MRALLRRRYGHGAARIPLAGSAPRWSAGGSMSHALRPLITAFLGCALMLLALPWFVPNPDEYAPLEFVLETVPPREAPAPDPVPAREAPAEVEAHVALEPPPAQAPPAVAPRAQTRPALPDIASVGTLAAVPDLPRLRARRPSQATAAPRAPLRADVRFASTPEPKLAPVSARPAERASRAKTQTEGSAPSPVRAVMAAADPGVGAGAPPDDVPLGRLAPCASRAEEDALKRRVIASRNARGTCESNAGSYRFVESRNLNAFLLRIRRNPDREVANRCEELEFALECLAQPRKESSKS